MSKKTNTQQRSFSWQLFDPTENLLALPFLATLTVCLQKIGGGKGNLPIRKLEDFAKEEVKDQ